MAWRASRSRLLATTWTSGGVAGWRLQPRTDTLASCTIRSFITLLPHALHVHNLEMMRMPARRHAPPPPAAILRLETQRRCVALPLQSSLPTRTTAAERPCNL